MVVRLCCVCYFRFDEIGRPVAQVVPCRGALTPSQRLTTPATESPRVDQNESDTANRSAGITTSVIQDLPIPKKIRRYKMYVNQKNVNTFVGVDISKKGMEVIRVSEQKKHMRFRTQTTARGERRLITWLNKNDVIVMEAGSQTFRIAKHLKQYGFNVIVLNPGDVRTIYGSLRKTDKEDALKLARIAQRNPREELPEVMIPCNEDEDARRLVTEHKHWTDQKKKHKNRLHSLFTQAGLTTITKKNIATHASREKVIPLLPERYQREAQRIQKGLQLVDENLRSIDTEIVVSLQENIGYAHLAMSMPGIGLNITHSLYAYVGNCSRFSSPKQLAYYVGLVPRVDQSGETERYGSITKRGCGPLRRVMIQGAWALVRSNHGGPLKEFYLRLEPRIGKKKAIVATARKMLETFYVMMQTGELYRDVPDEFVDQKMKKYGLIA